VQRADAYRQDWRVGCARCCSMMPVSFHRAAEFACVFGVNQIEARCMCDCTPDEAEVVCPTSAPALAPTVAPAVALAPTLQTLPVMRAPFSRQQGPDSGPEQKQEQEHPGPGTAIATNPLPPQWVGVYEECMRSLQQYMPPSQRLQQNRNRSDI
jgi:hypothetical protein